MIPKRPPLALTGAYGPYVLSCGTIILDAYTTRVTPADWNEGKGFLPSFHHRLVWLQGGEMRLGAGAAAAVPERDEVLFLAAGTRLVLRVVRPVVAVQVLFDAMAGTRRLGRDGHMEGLARQQPGALVVWGFEPPVRVPEPHAQGARDLIRRIRRRYHLSPREQLRASALLGLWLSDLIALAGDHAGATAPQTSDDDAIDRILTGAVTIGSARIGDLADQAGCSPDHFRRLVRRRAGCPPRDWLRQRRLEAAAEQLANSQDRVAAIATRAGYHSAAAFTRAFRQAFATTPLVWRRRHH